MGRYIHIHFISFPTISSEGILNNSNMRYKHDEIKYYNIEITHVNVSVISIHSSVVHFHFT